MKFTLEKMEHCVILDESTLGEDEKLAKIVIFKILMKQIFNQVSNDKLRKRVKLHIRENLHTLQLNMFIEVGFTQWLIDDTQLPLRDFPTEALQRIVNLAYVAVCEYLGPVAADNILREAVKKAATAESNEKFSVKNLI